MFRSVVVGRHARVAMIGDPDTAREAWLILHGYGMLAQGILHWFRAAARPNRVLIAPEGLSRFYIETNGVRRVGASWMTREAREHELLDQLAYLDVVERDIVGSRDRVELHGFSQGVATAARWLVHRPRVVDRMVCWGNTIPIDVEPGRLASAVGEGQVHYVIGRRDVRMAPADVVTDADRLRGLGIPVRLHEFDGGHRIDDGVLTALEAADGQPIS